MCDLPAPGLLSASEQADLLVVGARGLGGFRGLVLGSVSQQVLHHARIPLAVVRVDGADGAADADPTGASEAGTRERVVVGVDGSDPSMAALRWALAEGAVRKAVVQVVHAWDAPVIYGPVSGVSGSDVGVIEGGARRMVEEMVDQAEQGGSPVDVEQTAIPGGAAASLLDAAGGADLVVVGRRGMGGFGRLLLGSVSENVARHARCPVVVVPVAPEG